MPWVARVLGVQPVFKGGPTVRYRQDRQCVWEFSQQSGGNQALK